MKAILPHSDHRSSAREASARESTGQRSGARQLWAIRLENQETGVCLDVDGIVLTWFTRSPEAGIRELMEGRDPEIWQPRVERLLPQDETIGHGPASTAIRSRRAERLRLAFDPAREPVRTEWHLEAKGQRTRLRTETPLPHRARQ
jgi:hypothetical protein